MIRAEPALLPPTAARRTTARPGRSHSAETVAQVRSLIVESNLTYRQAAARIGVDEGTVGAWARRFGWRRVRIVYDTAEGRIGRGGLRPGGFVRAGRASEPRRRQAEEPSDRAYRSAEGESACFETARAAPPQHDAVESVPLRFDGGARWHDGRSYSPALREAARLRVEGSRDALQRIGRELGVDRGTLLAWSRRFGWQRPSGPDKCGPQFYRYRRPGRPYAADAVGIARKLATQTDLSHARIAAQAGVTQATVTRWIARHGWERPPMRRAVRRPNYGLAIVEAAGTLYRTTELSTRMIAARVGATPDRVALWARMHGWTRPSAMPDAHGRVRRRGRWVRA